MKAGDADFPSTTFDEASTRKFGKGKLSYHFNRQRAGRPMGMPQHLAGTRGKSKEPMIKDRTDGLREVETLQDPMGVIQRQFAKMLVAEIQINDELYSHEHIDSSALSESNKRMIALGEALKALPKQQPLAATGAQRSTAEIIRQAAEKRKEEQPAEAPEEKLGEQMVNRASTAFGEGA